MCVQAMGLQDTIEMMASNDYKERFKAEYYQVVIRYVKLKDMLEKWDKNELNFKPTCPKWMYEEQMRTMGEYIDILQDRAKIENIDI